MESEARQSSSVNTDRIFSHTDLLSWKRPNIAVRNGDKASFRFSSAISNLSIKVFSVGV